MPFFIYEADVMNKKCLVLMIAALFVANVSAGLRDAGTTLKNVGKALMPERLRAGTFPTDNNVYEFHPYSEAIQVINNDFFEEFVIKIDNGYYSQKNLGAIYKKTIQKDDNNYAIIDKCDKDAKGRFFLTDSSGRLVKLRNDKNYNGKGDLYFENLTRDGRLEKIGDEAAEEDSGAKAFRWWKLKYFETPWLIGSSAVIVATAAILAKKGYDLYTKYKESKEAVVTFDALDEDDYEVIERPDAGDSDEQANIENADA